MKNLSKFSSAAMTALALAASAGQASPFTAGSLVVVRVGDGVAAISTAAAAGFLEERDANTGNLIQTIPLPIAAVGSNGALTFSGSSTSEGFVTLSANGQYLLIGGYNAAPGTPAVAGTSASTTSRVVARIDLNGNVDTTTQLNDSSGNPRSAASDNGTNIWLASNSVGVRYTTFGASGASTQITNPPTNVRVVNVFSGQLYLTSAAGSYFGVAAVGAGLPTTSGQTTTLLPGMSATSGPSPYDYFFSNATTLYVADDRVSTSGGGIQKWTQSAGNWALQYTIPLATSGNGARGLTGRVDGGTTTLWATSSAGTANSVFTAIDGGASTTATLMSPTTAGTNMILRGVRVLPPPVTQEGACCLPAGTCVQASSAACAAQGGTYNGNGSACGSCPQPGACCFPDGSCQVLSNAQCTSQSGVYGGNGSACGTCPQPGGCCLPSGICLIMSQGQCTTASGTFSGNGSSCPATCAAARTGACCAGNGTCSLTTLAACSGTYRGDGTSCATSTCGAFDAANLVVLEATGTAGSTATSVNLREIRISDGATIQAIGLPAVRTENGNRAATVRGASSTEGELTRSTDGHYLVYTGYNMDNGGADPTGSTLSRVVARVDASGRVDTHTAFTDSTFSGSSPRGAVSVDGSSFWLSGAAFPNGTTDGGIRYALFQASSSTQLNTDLVNTRDILIFGGNLFFSYSSGGGHVAQLGTGLPTTSGQTSAALSLLGPPLPDDAQGFFFSDANTLYMGGNAASTLPGVRKFSFDGTDWNAQYQMDAGGTFLHPIQQLTGVVNGGVVTLYGTEALGGNGASGPGNTLYKIVDNGSSTSPYTAIATAGAGVTWKGVALAPTASGVTCYPNCDHSTAIPFLNVQDFSCFLTKYAAADPYANCDNSTQPPVLNVQDFSCFLTKYAAGCSAP